VAGLPRDRIQVILNPVVSEETLQKAKAPVEHPWFSNGGAPVVLAIGRMTEQKDFPNLLRALALLVQRRPARVLILGEGEDRPALEALAKELNLGPDVLDMPGFVENPYAYMARCDVLAMSSRWEGLPTVLIEGLACGASIVSTACPSGPDEILEDGRYGRLVPVNDSAALADALAQTLDAPRVTPPEESWAPYVVGDVTRQYRGALLGSTP
jgi:glycosyltransferase involved in cell wall biosynthesis